MDVHWTRHAEERQRQWEKTMGLTRKLVEETLRHPEQVVPADLGLEVAHRRWKGGLLRVPFARSADGVRVVTVYWTTRVAKYWRNDP